MIKRSVVLLGTTGCHLCVEALEVIREFNSIMSDHAYGVCVTEEDISKSEALVAEYGTRIPVVIDQSTGEELNWPFDAEALYKFLRQCDVARG